MSGSVGDEIHKKEDLPEPDTSEDKAKPSVSTPSGIHLRLHSPPLNLPRPPDNLPPNYHKQKVLRTPTDLASIVISCPKHAVRMADPNRELQRTLQEEEDQGAE